MLERILMIEDDENLAEMVAEYLGAVGFEVTTRGEPVRVSHSSSGEISMRSFSTSCCPTSTVSRFVEGYAPNRTFPFSC